MRMTARKSIVLMLGLLLAAGIPYLGATAVQADPGCGCHEGKGHGGGCGHHGGCGCCEGGCGDGCVKDCGHKACGGCRHQGGCGCGQTAQRGCEQGCPKDAGQAGAECPCGMQDNTAAGHGGMHAMMHGGKDAPPMKERMGKHLEAMKSTIRKLRDLEAKMEGLQAKDDAAAFRAASLEHAKLLTDLQESHLRHMEGMMGGGK